jgi:hypothetical protein
MSPVELRFVHGIRPKERASQNPEALSSFRSSFTRYKILPALCFTKGTKLDDILILVSRKRGEEGKEESVATVDRA